MKLKILFFVFLLVCSSCALDKRDIISSNFDFADIQLKHAFVEMDSVYKSTDKLLANPRNIDPNGFLRMVASHDWTSGFFPSAGRPKESHPMGWSTLKPFMRLKRATMSVAVPLIRLFSR